jgi:putative Mn2+ efflux pump MntP
MGIWELLLLAVGVSMDAFAVAICKGLALQKVNLKQTLWVGLWFGGFQALMPTIGYFLGATFTKYIEAVDHWVAFALLALIGGNMLRECFSRCSCEDEETDASLSVRAMLVLAIATSIDALAVGVTFPTIIENPIHLPLTVIAIGVITCTLSAIGVWVGSVVGTRFKKKAEFLGGLILVLLGIKILLEHLGIISF